MRDNDVLRAETGLFAAAAAKRVEPGERAVYRWRTQYSGMRRGDTKRLQELAKENGRLPISSVKHRKRVKGNGAGRRGTRSHHLFLPCLH